MTMHSNCAVGMPCRAKLGGALLPSQLCRGRDAIESLERKDGAGELLGAALQHRAGQSEEFLRHRLRVRERIRLARGVGIEPLVDAVVCGDRNTRAKGMAAADFEAVVLHHVELVGERVDRGIAELVVIVPAEALIPDRPGA